VSGCNVMFFLFFFLEIPGGNESLKMFNQLRCLLSVEVHSRRKHNLSGNWEFNTASCFAGFDSKDSCLIGHDLGICVVDAQPNAIFGCDGTLLEGALLPVAVFEFQEGKASFCFFHFLFLSFLGSV